MGSGKSCEVMIKKVFLLHIFYCDLSTHREGLDDSDVTTVA